MGRMGWSILCLDYRAFRPVRTTKQFLGCQPLKNPFAWNISPCFQSIQNCSLRLQGRPLHGPGNTAPDTRTRRQHRSAVTLNVTADGENIAETEGSENQEEPNGSEEFSEDSDSIESNSSGSEEGILFGKLPVQDLERLPFLLFWTSDLDLLLTSPHFDLRATYLRKALEQHPPIENPYRLDRLNMVTQIPELGIIVAASQIGRVALITLTRRNNHKWEYGFRIDSIVPFESQESAGHRPDTQLLGVAVAPIQGQQLKPESILDDDTQAGGDDQQRSTHSAAPASRRYRLMLTYYDMTVLSYEIGRPQDDLDGGNVVFF
jgi:hypothetical protein